MKTVKRLWKGVKRRLGFTKTNQIDPASLPPGMIFGNGCIILGKPRIKVVPSAEIVCGDGVVLNSDPTGYHIGMSFPVTLLADQPDARIIIGEESRLHGCCIHAWSQITIGRKCLLAAGSQVIDSHGHATEMEYARIREKVQDLPEPIDIGDYCWLGLGALVFKGVKLGEGCIVAAYSVVMSGEYPPFSLLAGSPAKILRTLPETAILPENYSVENAELGRRKIYKYT